MTGPAKIFSRSVSLCFPRYKGYKLADPEESPKARRNVIKRRPAKRGTPNLSSISEVSIDREQPTHAAELQRIESAESFPQRPSMDPARNEESATTYDERSILEEMTPCSRVSSYGVQSIDSRDVFHDFDFPPMPSPRRNSAESPFQQRHCKTGDYGAISSPSSGGYHRLAERVDTIEARLATLKHMHDRAARDLEESFRARDDETSVLRRLVNRTCEHCDVLQAALKATQSQMMQMNSQVQLVARSHGL